MTAARTLNRRPNVQQATQLFSFAWKGEPTAVCSYAHVIFCAGILAYFSLVVFCCFTMGAAFFTNSFQCVQLIPKMRQDEGECLGTHPRRGECLTFLPLCCVNLVRILAFALQHD